MNFLAHIYLSGDNTPLMIGNFIADHVKGKTIETLSPEVKAGVTLHRKIDFFTDHHPIVENSKARLRPLFRKYAPVVTDIFYDHFLASKWKNFSDISLPDFAKRFYSTINENFNHLPDRTKQMFPYMVSNNWLVNYATVEGVTRVLAGMAKRSTFESRMEFAGEELLRNYSDYENEFLLFFKELEGFVRKEKNGMW